jgi:hypothetical protein
MMTATTTATTRTLPPAWGAYEYMAEADRVCEIRYAQGWDADPEYGWGGQCPITKQWFSESEWEDEGLLPLPEDYSAFDTALVNWLREGDATYEGSGMDLHLFHRIALAHCAMTRARTHVINNERWDGEYITARLWGGQ